MKKERKPFKFSKITLGFLASLLVLVVGITTFAATGGLENAVNTLTAGSDATYTTKDGTWVKVDENTWTMDTDADGDADVTLVKNGDEWEYYFVVSDDEATYYGWEEPVPDDYEVSGSGERANPSVKTKDSTDFSITNKQKEYDEPDYGSLKLSKVITGDSADANQNFKFTVTLSTEDETLEKKLEGRKTFGDTSFKDGVATVYLKGGESVTLTDIPVGVTWTIEEDKAEDYETKIEGGTAVEGNANAVTGDVVKDETTQVTYTNNKDSSVLPVVEKGTFKVKKVVENGKDTDEFYFSASLSGLEAQTDYTVTVTKADGSDPQEITVSSSVTGMAYVEFQLKNGDVAEFSNFPVGCFYQIQEEPNDFSASYEITDEVNEDNLFAVMSRDVFYGSGDYFSTQKETLDQNENALITFTNAKPAPITDALNIEVEKTWADDDDAENLRPDTITVHLYQSTSKDEKGDMVATAYIDESQSWKTVFEEMPKYQPNGEDLYIYTLEEEQVIGYDTTVSMDDDENFKVINTLSDKERGDLLISKSVSGHNADTTKEFRFDITVTNEDDTPLTGIFALNSDEGKGTKTGTVYFDDEGKATIYLKDGESAYIEGLPEGTKYSVKETGYLDWIYKMLNDTTLEGTITKDEVSNVTVKNVYVEKHDVSVSNTIKGNLGDKTRDFSFEFTLTPPEDVTIPETLTYEKDGVEYTITAVDGVYKFTLGHEETITFKDLPYGTKYELVETDGKSSGYKVTSENAKGTIEGDTDISFVNEKNATVPTLAAMNIIIPCALIVLGAAGLIAMFVLRRRNVS